MSKAQEVIKGLTDQQKEDVSGMLDDIEGCSFMYGIPTGFVMDALSSLGQPVLDGLTTKHKMATAVGEKLVAAGVISEKDFQIIELAMSHTDNSRYGGVPPVADFRLFTLVDDAVMADKRQEKQQQQPVFVLPGNATIN